MHRFALLAAVVAAGIFVVYAVVHIPRDTTGFAAYYTSARSLLEGRDLAAEYTPATLNAHARSYGIATADYPNNLPTNAIALAPVAWLAPSQARIAWSVVSIALFAVSVWLLFKIYNVDWRGTTGLALVALALLWRPVYDNVALGQLYFALLFLFVLSLRGVALRRPFLTAVPIAVALLIKGYGVVPLAWLAYNRRWKECGIVVGTVLIVVIAMLPVIPVATWSVYYHTVFLSLGRLPSDAHVAYQAVNNWMRHLFLFDGTWHPYPIIVLSEPLVTAITIVLDMIIAALVFLPKRNAARSLPLEFSGAIAVGVVTSPLAAEYHYVLFLPFVFGMTAQFAAGPSWKIVVRNTWFALACMLVLALPLPYHTMNLVPPPLILLAWPKLYAGIGLIAAARMPGPAYTNRIFNEHTQR